MTFTQAELRLWDEDPGENGPRADDRAINERYSRGEGRIVIETNREKLPGFVSAIKEPGYMDLRPFYQRRPRWNTRKQSLLIESFIMNIPVPPIFLYERDYNSYEVMDGQKRVTAIRDFYENRFALSGLEMWSELNGRFYHNLPDKLRAGIDRRSITSIVLLKESTSDEEDATFLRETVFERLNTGGVELERQEIRNALFQGKFNDLLFELSRDDNFRAVWGVPRYVENEIDRNPELLQNTFYSKMGDIEIILRFFALRHAEHYPRGMQGFLDLYMMKGTKAFRDDDIRDLRNLYLRWSPGQHRVESDRPCSTVTRLYAIYERFIRELLSGYLTFIEGNIPYSDLDSKIRIAYRRQIGRILIDLDQDRYQSLRLESIVADLSNGINASGPYRLLPEAMLAHDQNLRLNELITIFDRCGITELASWIARHRTLRDFFRTESRQSDTAEAELKQLVDFRNEASHGGIEIDTVLGPKILIEYLEFMQALCRSLAERVQKAALITSEIAKKTEKLGIITEKYSDNRAVAIIRAATLRQNDSIYLVGETYCYRVVIVSLMDNDVAVETLTTLEAKEVGLRFNTEPTMRAQLYAI